MVVNKEGAHNVVDKEGAHNPFILYIIIIDIDNPYLYLGLHIKGKFACPICGPKIKSRRSKISGKEVSDEYTHFLSKNHRYRTTKKNLYNGKQETALKPQIMTPHLWKLQYNRNCQGTCESSYMKCYVFFSLCVVYCN